MKDETKFLIEIATKALNKIEDHLDGVCFKQYQSTDKINKK